MQTIALLRRLPLARLVADLDAHRPDGTNLSSLLRVFVLGTVLEHRREGPDVAPPLSRRDDDDPPAEP